MTINYLDAPAGAGKTYLLQEKVAKLVKSGDGVIFCQPTNADRGDGVRHAIAISYNCAEGYSWKKWRTSRRVDH
jgi:hypothetical protein